ncbi:MAG: LysR family transcriptional regulator, partial [Pseudomonadota bacterium]
MRQLQSLSAYRAFEAAARHLSFKLAARELNVSPTAVSHQIRGLERQMGSQLFDRKPRQVTLTANGVELFHSLKKAFDEIE